MFRKFIFSCSKLDFKPKRDSTDIRFFYLSSGDYREKNIVKILLNSFQVIWNVHPEHEQNNLFSTSTVEKKTINIGIYIYVL